MNFIIILFCIALVGGQINCPPGTKHTIRYGLFNNDSLVLIAYAKGYWAEEKVCVKYNAVTSSTQQFNSLYAGDYDLINTAADNIATRYVNLLQPLSIVATVDRLSGFVIVGNSANGINTLSDLANKPLAVDSPVSGYVLLLQEVLGIAGVPVNKSLYQQIGGGPREVAVSNGWWINPATMMNETVYGCVFSGVQFYKSTLSPNVKILAHVSDYLPNYQSQIIAGTHTWIDNNKKALRAFLRGLEKAREFLFEPKNAKEVKKLWQTSPLPYTINPAKMNDFYNGMVDPDFGYNEDCDIDADATKGMIQVREHQIPFNGTYSISKLLKSRKGGFYNVKECRNALWINCLFDLNINIGVGLGVFL